MAKATIRRKLKKRHPTSEFFGKREPVAAVCGKQVKQPRLADLPL
jgi:hypothetical protein